MLKSVLKQILRIFNLEARRLQAPGSHLRPIADVTAFMFDVRARGFSPRLIFDGGASNGEWTKRAIEPVFPDAKVILVEPRPQMQPALESFCTQHATYVRVPSAIGATAGSSTMTIDGRGSTLLPIDAPHLPRITVPVTTLDALARTYGIPDVIKLDIEGFELNALHGASTVLGITELLILEVALFPYDDRPVLSDVVAFLAGRDYSVYDIAGYIRRPSDGAMGLMDVCFARRHGYLRRHEFDWMTKTS